MNANHLQMLAFITESNWIEGIHREPTDAEITVHAAFLSLRTVTINDLESFIAEIAGALLRDQPGLDVRVGAHVPPPGGPRVREILASILAEVNARGGMSPYAVHQDYEHLHPFMDGNGRSGRALWAWHMRRRGQDPFALPFLHRWYYQSLDAGRRS